MGDKDKLDGMRRLEQFVRAVEERCEPEAQFEAAVQHEQEISASLNGRSVQGHASRTRVPTQRPLF